MVSSLRTTIFFTGITSFLVLERGPADVLCCVLHAARERSVRDPPPPVRSPAGHPPGPNDSIFTRQEPKDIRATTYLPADWRCTWRGWRRKTTYVPSRPEQEPGEAPGGGSFP